MSSTGIPPGGFRTPFTPPPINNLPPLQAPLVPIANPQWEVVERTSMKSILSDVGLSSKDNVYDGCFMTSDGNKKKIPGDLHSTMDMSPESETFGKLHSTLRLNKYFKDFHSS